MRRKTEECNRVKKPLVSFLRAAGDRNVLVEPVTPAGRPDIVTSTEIIECKLSLSRSTFHQALGQLVCYLRFWPTKTPALACLYEPCLAVRDLAAMLNIKIYVVAPIVEQRFQLFLNRPVGGWGSDVPFQATDEPHKETNREMALRVLGLEL